MLENMLRMSTFTSETVKKCILTLQRKDRDINVRVIIVFRKNQNIIVF